MTLNCSAVSFSAVVPQNFWNEPYTVVIEPDLDEGGFVATVPVLRIATQGETLDEVRQLVHEAIAGYLEGLKQEGQPIPVESETQAAQIRTEQVAVQV